MKRWRTRRYSAIAVLLLFHPIIPLSSAQERAASLALDFTDPSVFDKTPHLRFSRKGAGRATYFDSKGVLQAAAADKPRVDHQPFLCNDHERHIHLESSCEREPRGILLEEERTNFLNFSENLSAWAVYPRREGNLPDPRFAARAVDVAPPTLWPPKSWKLIAPQESDKTFVLVTEPQVPASSSDEDFVVSFFIKDKDPQWQVLTQEAAPRTITVRVGENTGGFLVDIRRQHIRPDDNDLLRRLRNGTAAPEERLLESRSRWGYQYGVLPLSRGWFRVWLRFRISKSVLAGNGTTAMLPLRVRLNRCHLEACSDPIVWGFQLEKGRYPTSYIPTNGAATTRGEDRLELRPPDGERLPFFNPKGGFFLVDADTSLRQENHISYLFDLSHVSGRRQGVFVQHSRGSAGYFSMESAAEGPTYSYGPGGSLSTLGEVFRVSYAYDGSTPAPTGALGINGAALSPVEKPLSNQSGLREIRFGYYPGYERALNGHLKSFRYTPVVPRPAEQIVASILGVRPGTIDDSTIDREGSGWRKVGQLSEECRGEVDPIDGSPFSQRWETKDVKNASSPESHICSFRYPRNIRIGSDLKPGDPLTDRDIAFLPPGDPRRKVCRFVTGPEPSTGSMWTRSSQQYGYFTSRFYVNGGMREVPVNGGETSQLLVPNRRLNNAFWMMSWTDATKRGQGMEWEVDINEGMFPDTVRTNLHNQTGYISDEGKNELFVLSENGLTWRDPREMAAAQESHIYSLLWTPSRLSYYVDDLLIREMPNYVVHKPGYVFFSTALLKSSAAGAECEGLEPDIGKDVLIRYIRSYRGK